MLFLVLANSSFSLSASTITYESKLEGHLFKDIKFDTLETSPLSQAKGGAINTTIEISKYFSGKDESENSYLLFIERFIYSFLQISSHTVVFKHYPESGVLLLEDMDHTLHPLGKKLDKDTAPFPYEFCFEVLKTIALQSDLEIRVPEVFDFKGIQSGKKFLDERGFEPAGYFFNPKTEIVADSGAAAADEEMVAGGGAAAAEEIREGFTRVALKDITINLMWLNMSANPQSTYIVDTIEKEPFETFGVDQILKWMVLNPESKVVYWYDASNNTEEQVNSTLEAVQKKIVQVNQKSRVKVKSENFDLREIQSLEYVSAEPGKSIFKNSAFKNRDGVYLKADLARMLAAIETLKKEEDKAYIHADWTVNPHSIREIYPYGFHDSGFMAVKCLSVFPPWENSYMVFTPGKKNLLLVFSKLFESLLERIKTPIGSKRNLLLDGYPRIPIDANSLLGFLVGAAKFVHSEDIYNESSLKELELGRFYAVDVHLSEGATVETVTLTRNSSHSTRVPIGPNVTLEETLKSLNN